MLRTIAIDRLSFTNPAKKNPNMINSSYWADTIMIEALCAEIDVTPVLIESQNQKIYCDVLAKGKYRHNSTIKHENETRIIEYNDIDKLKKSTDKFVLIYYQTEFHFEAIYTKENDYYITYFNGFNEFQAKNPEMANHIITVCRFKTKKEAEIETLEQLKASLALKKSKVVKKRVSFHFWNNFENLGFLNF